MSLVQEDVRIPDGLSTPSFTLRPLSPADNEADFAAWRSSIGHIRATPGFAGRDWPPDEFTLAQNERDLEGHRDDFAARRGFTYTVLDPSGATVGCLYLYPAEREEYDVDVRSWVTADRAELDAPLHDAVLVWLAEQWPFRAPDYAGR